MFQGPGSPWQTTSARGSGGIAHSAPSGGTKPREASWTSRRSRAADRAPSSSHWCFQQSRPASPGMNRTASTSPSMPTGSGTEVRPWPRRWSSRAWMVGVQGWAGRSTRSPTMVTPPSTSCQSRRLRTGRVNHERRRCRRDEGDWRGERPRPVQRTDPHLVRRGVRRADQRAVRCLGRDQQGPPRTGGGADGLRQDAERLPVGDRPAALAGGARQVAVPRPLRLAAQGARRRRGAQPPRASHRHPAHRRAARHGAPRRTRRRALRRHQRRRPAPAHHPPSRHPDHHPRVAVPDAHQPGPGVPPRGGDGDRRRGARRRRQQARRPSRPQPRAPRRAPGATRAADRPLRHGPPAGGGGPIPRRHRTGRDRRAQRARSAGTSRSWSPSRT